MYKRQGPSFHGGLDLLNLSGPGMCDGLNRMENRAKLTAEIAESIALAAANRVSQVIVFSGNRNGQDTREGFRNCRQALCELAPAASRAGVTLLFEMLNSIDHKDYQADHSAFGFELAQEVNSPAFRVLYDVYHMHRMGQDVRNDILTNLPWIGHIHVAGAPKRDDPGDGQEIDYRTIVAATHRAGYRGFWGMEFLPGPGGIDELTGSIARFQNYAV